MWATVVVKEKSWARVGEAMLSYIVGTDTLQDTKGMYMAAP